MESHSSAADIERAILLPAAGRIPDFIAVANGQLGLSTETPKRMLHESREVLRVIPIESAGIDLRGDVLDNLGTSPIPIAGYAISMIGLQLPQEA